MAMQSPIDGLGIIRVSFMRVARDHHGSPACGTVLAGAGGFDGYPYPHVLELPFSALKLAYKSPLYSPYRRRGGHRQGCRGDLIAVTKVVVVTSLLRLPCRRCRDRHDRLIAVALVIVVLLLRSSRRHWGCRGHLVAITSVVIVAWSLAKHLEEWPRRMVGDEEHEARLNRVSKNVMESQNKHLAGSKSAKKNSQQGLSENAEIDDKEPSELECGTIWKRTIESRYGEVASNPTHSGGDSGRVENDGSALNAVLCTGSSCGSVVFCAPVAAVFVATIGLDLRA
ncbi:hypothetical protein EDB85DRAFT_1897511 [Lactarius pseudohatsudake]|nr:hypothetical protein EDB85DRAFT_1897511 [Lactarius pseudohatsudake]